MDFSDEKEFVCGKIRKYINLLDNPSKIGYALKRLERINMTVEFLSETGIGKIINQLRNNEEHGKEASQLVEKWKKVAVESGLKRKRSESPSASNATRDAPAKKRSSEKNISERGMIEKGDISPVQIQVNPLKNRDSNQVSFAEMLALADVKQSKAAKKSTIKAKVDWQTSEFNMNYKPARQLYYPQDQPPTSDPSILDASVFKPRKEVRKVYAGRPKFNALREVPTLVDVCIKVLSHNIDAIEEVGDTPYYLLKSVLEKCTPEQLMLIERKNPQLMEESDELWVNHVKLVFHEEEPLDDETWREYFARLKLEKEQKLRKLTKRINQHNREVKAPVKTAILADAKAPREVRKRQIRYGTGHVMHQLPSAAHISRARKAIFNEGSKEALMQLPTSVKNSNPCSSTSRSSLPRKEPVKKGMLMLKVKKLMKGLRR